MSTRLHDGRRIVLDALLDSDRVCFLAEAQRSGSQWALEQQWGPTSWHRPRMPRTAAQVQQLTDTVVAWLSRPGV
ncbi:hypothetical protein GCM10010250_66600 [Streptomyces althioticus]|nr:hypothetical protein GCM10010250_66600 [Streptomyces althioticus]